jgi:hypothetical protein
MKIIKVISILVILLSITTADAFSKPKHHQHRKQNHPTTRPTVGAPLDGGILTVLGAAGVAYFVARKKKNNDLGV